MKKESLISIITAISLTTASAAVVAVPRHSVNPGWFGPLSQWWQMLGDYEASSFSMGVSEYYATYYNLYRTSVTQSTRHMWLSSNGSEYFFSWYSYDGVTSTDSNPFSFIPERRVYSCAAPEEDEVQFRTDIQSWTKWWLKHEVTRWPDNANNLSPAAGFAKIGWTYNTLATGCGPFESAEGFTLTEKSYTKSGTVSNIALPVANAEVPSSPVAGKDL